MSVCRVQCQLAYCFTGYHVESCQESKDHTLNIISLPLIILKNRSIHLCKLLFELCFLIFESHFHLVLNEMFPLKTLSWPFFSFKIYDWLVVINAVDSLVKNIHTYFFYWILPINVE